MVNVLLYRCCAAQINSSRKSGRGAVMQPFIKRSIPPLPQSLSPSGSGSILPSPLERRRRGQGFSTSFSEEKKAEERSALLSFASLPSLFSLFPLLSSYFLSYSSCYPSPLRPEVCIFALPDR